MKSSIHPQDYKLVVFEDLNTKDRFMMKSTASSSDTVTIDGTDYPLIKVHISRTSHPFFTGQEKLVDIEGRVDKFEARRKAGQEALQNRSKVIKKDRTKKSDNTKQKLGAKSSSPKSKSESK